jgi:hypothetical protein
MARRRAAGANPLVGTQGKQQGTGERRLLGLGLGHRAPTWLARLIASVILASSS